MKKPRSFQPKMIAQVLITTGLLFFLLFPLLGIAQDADITTTVVDSSHPGFRTVIAGIEYKRGFLHRFFWGSHYRKEWTTPVEVPVINLDTEAGGLRATEQGGGRQTKTLRLKDRNGKEYVLRSIDKDYRGALPEITHGTFIENLAKDQVSTAHPFASITVPPMIGAASVYHTNPRIVFVPYTPSLGEYNKTFANLLCLFEERPDDDQSNSPNFGNSKDVGGTEKMFEKVFGENDHRVDQRAFVRARLFDMFLGDWGRHEDQWRWAKFDSADFKIYRPIPRDRDQMWAKFDGVLVHTITGVEALEHLQTFKGKIRNIKKYNFPARYLDRQFTNEIPEQYWLDQARDLQQILTDTLIESSVRRMPPELFAISGREIVGKLKQRRNDLVDIAEKYYKFISAEVDVVGSKQDEYFEIKKLGREDLQVNIYDLNKQGQRKDKPYYSRIFHGNETDEINIYGRNGNDVYHVEGDDQNRITLRIIGGPDKDSIYNTTASSRHIKYYDNPGNAVVGSVKQHLANDTSINSYNYRAFKYNEGHKILRPWYTNTRGVHIQFGYSYTKQTWRKEPYGWHQALFGYYSISNHSWGGQYEADFNQLLGKWSLKLGANFDQKLEQFFFGSGNETGFDFDRNAYRYFTKDIGGEVGLERPLGRFHHISITGFYQTVKIDDPEDHQLSKLPFSDPTLFDTKRFTGADLGYRYHNYNDEVVPTKGLHFAANYRRTFNLTESDRSFNRYSALLGFYLPLSKQFSLAIRTGGVSVDGDPEFYQLAALGGGSSLRGYYRQRFHGKTMVYNNNDLRWIFNTHNYFFNGKIGLIAFFDDGRVWMPNEDSEKWHIGYGGGLMLVPFNKASLTVYYGLSEETQRFHIRLGKLF